MTLQAPSFPANNAIQVALPPSLTNYLRSFRSENIDLAADGLTSIAFPPGMTGCNVMYFAVIGGSKVDLTLSSADGTAQVVPVDPLILQYMNSVPLTAISATRAAGEIGRASCRERV